MAFKKPTTHVAKVLDEHRRRLARLAEKRGVSKLKSLYDRAQAEQMKKLRDLPGRKDTFTAYHNKLIQAQLRQGQAAISRQMADELGTVSRDAQVEGLQGVIDDISTLEKHFTGTTPVLPIEEASQFWGIIDERSPSLMRMHETSMKSYGKTVVVSMEEQIGLSLAQGETLEETINRIEETADLEFWQAERIARCLPGETLVTGAVVRAAHRRWYEGTMVEIVTESGSKLTATPNHPMLTQRGWLRQGSILEGDYLIRHTGKKDARTSGHKNVAGGPSTIAQIFDSVSAIGVCERGDGTEPDFHGDGRKGDVDIARSDRELMYGIFSPLTQPSAESVFSPTDRSFTRFCPSCRGLLPYDRSCFCSGARTHTHRVETSRYNSVVHPVRLSNLRATFSRFIAPFYFLYRQRNGFVAFATGAAGLLGLRLISSNSSNSEVAIDTLTCDSQVNRNLSPAESGEIEVDRVTGVFIREFSGHVFNLSTTDGYYAINGYYTGNTETAYAYNRSASDGIEELAEEVDDLYLRWTEAVSDDGVPFDTRVGLDSLALHGQVVRPGDEFEVPPFTPDGRPVPEGLVGKRMLVPPSRPNGREVVSAWRPSWGGLAWLWVDGERVAVGNPEE